MSDRFFLDTNIFVYSFDRSAVMKAQKATQLICNTLKTQKGIISYQVVQEFFNVALRKFSEPMKAGRCRAISRHGFPPPGGCAFLASTLCRGTASPSQKRLVLMRLIDCLGRNPGPVRFPLYRGSAARTALRKSQISNPFL